MKILKIENKTGRVKLDDTVDEYSRKELAREMESVFGPAALTNPEFVALTASAENEIDTLEIEINSPGGSVFDGMLIFNELRAMRNRGVRVVAIVNVLAASMGSVIAMAADEVLIAPNGRMMIHDASMFAGGTAKDLARYAELLESISNEIAGIYAAKTGKTVEECRALMLDETWMDSAKCIDLGFADGIFDIQPPKSNIKAMSILDRLTNPSGPEALEKIQLLESAISDKESIIEDLTASIGQLKDEAQSFADVRARLEKAIETLTAEAVEKDRIANESAQTISDLQAKLEAAEKSTGKKAAEAIAAAGQPEPVANIEPNESESLESIYAKLKAETDPAKRTELYRQFRDTIKRTK